MSTVDLAFLKKTRIVPLFGRSRSSVPAYVNIGQPRAGVVKNGRS
jgi:hypothetical protein